MRIPLICLALAALPVSAARGENPLSVNNCPTPLYAGEWAGVSVGKAKVVAHERSGLVRVQTGTTDGVPGRATISLPSCDGTFLLELQGHAEKIVMRDMGNWVENKTPTYVGYVDAGPSRIKMTMNVLSPSEFFMAMGGEASFGSRGGGTFDTGMLVNYQGELKPRPECQCRELLEEFLAERKKETREWLEAYENPAFQERPGVLEPSEWNRNTYELLISYMVGGEMSYDAAVAELANELDEVGLEEVKKQSNKDTKGSIVAAYTNMSNGQPFYGNAHLTRCFPLLALEATKVHEGVHVSMFGKEMLTTWALIPHHARTEVEAHKAELAFYDSWIPKNCGG